MFKDRELLLCLHGQEPRPVQLGLHPVAHTAMLAFERGSQRSGGQRRATGRVSSPAQQTPEKHNPWNAMHFIALKTHIGIYFENVCINAWVLKLISRIWIDDCPRPWRGDSRCWKLEAECILMSPWMNSGESFFWVVVVWKKRRKMFQTHVYCTWDICSYTVVPASNIKTQGRGDKEKNKNAL